MEVMAMESRTVTVVLDAPSEGVFEYLSQVDNLPEWATDFARQLKYDDHGKAKVVNGLGEFFFTIDAHRGTGVIDMYAGPTEDQMALFPTRVVALGPETSAYTFTMFQGPGMDDGLFDAQHRSLQREFQNIRARFGGTAAS
jgi:hypothetical protein